MTYPEKLEQAWRDAKAPRPADAPTVISTFAGGGGSSTGYHMAGFRELLAIEWEENAVQTLRANYPGLDVLHADIAKVSVQDVLTRTGLAPGELDVLDGSPPCQGFSMAGKRAIDDDRNQLFREFVRLLRGLQPKVFVMENVSGMVKGKMKLIFAEILRELKAAGYVVSARLLNAKHYGVPQSRERMIFIGVRTDLGIAPSHPIGSATTVDLQAALTPRPTRKDAEPTAPTVAATKLWQETTVGDTHAVRFGLCRLAWNKVPPTITKAAGDAGHWHPDEPRRLNVGELKRIGSFPDSYEFSGRWANAVDRIGNSVPPLLMQAIALHIRDAILQRLADMGLEPRRIS